MKVEKYGRSWESCGRRRSSKKLKMEFKERVVIVKILCGSEMWSLNVQKIKILLRLLIWFVWEIYIEQEGVLE